MKPGIIAAAVAATAVGAVALLLSQTPDSESSDDGLLGSIAAAVSSGDAGTASCPISQTKQEQAVEAWDKMMPVFRHPRCQNCHGGIEDPFVQPGDPPKRHRQVVDIDSDVKRDGKFCQGCHVTGWHITGPFLHWVDKSDSDLCSKMKEMFDGPGFVDHIHRDGGATPFIDLAFEGRRGLDSTGQGIDVYEAETEKTFTAEPPPGTHEEFTQLARDWVAVATKDGKFVGDKDCGCVVMETREVYLLAIRIIDLRGVGGMIVVTDSVTMKIRVQDTTVTVYGLKNFKPTAVPGQVVSNFGVKSVTRWVDDEIGHMNIVKTVGRLDVDFPADGDRTLTVDFEHSDARFPAFITTYATGGKSKEGGGPFPRPFPFSSTFNLVKGKSVYEVTGRGANFKLTLLSSTEQKKGK